MDIKAIEKQLAEIDEKARDLEAKKNDVLRSDEEYAEYLDHYAAHYDDEPLSIRNYYMCSARLRELNRVIPGDLDHFEKYKAEILRLERVLAV